MNVMGEIIPENRSSNAAWPVSVDLNILVRNYLFLNNYITPEGTVSHNVLYNQQLSIARYQVSLC